MKYILLTALAAVGFAHISVQKSFADEDSSILTREIAIARAIDVAPGLDALRESVKAQSSAMRQAGVKPNPLLSTEVENFTGTGPFTGLGRSEITFTYNQRFERGGKRQSRMQVAGKEKQIAITQLQIQRLDIIRRTEQAFVGVLVAQAKLENAVEQHKVFENIHSAIKIRNDRGKDSKLAVQNARMRLLQAQNQMVQSEQSLAGAKQALASLWQQPDAKFSVESSVLFALPPHIAASETSKAATSPDLTLWQLRKARSASTVALEKANAIQDPTVKIGLRYLQGTSDVAAIAGVSIPFAFHDTNSGNIGKAKANHRKSQFELAEAERQLERSILIQENKRVAAYVQAKQIISELIPETEQTKQMVLERLKRGAASYLDVFSAQSLAATIQEQLLQVLEQYHLAQVELDRLTARHGLDATIFSDDTANGNMPHDGEGK